MAQEVVRAWDQVEVSKRGSEGRSEISVMARKWEKSHDSNQSEAEAEEAESSSFHWTCQVNHGETNISTSMGFGGAVIFRHPKTPSS